STSICGATTGSAWSIEACWRSPTGGTSSGPSPCSIPRRISTNTSRYSKKSHRPLARPRKSEASLLSVRPDTRFWYASRRRKPLANEVSRTPAAPGAPRYPGEGGVYLWAKRVFGDFHGFLSGWCYWTNNIFYVPTVLLYFVGISVYVAGPRARTLADNHLFALGASIVLLVLLAALNVRGLGVGKWINNLGGIGTAITAIMLIGLGLVVLFRFGTTMTAADFRITGDLRLIGSFGIICFGLVGLELASIMGDEIQDPGRTLPGAVGWGGLVSGILYVGATLTLLLAVSKQDIGVLQGVVQAVS